MIDAFVKAIAQLDDRGIQKWVLISVLAALGVFVVLWLAVGFLLANTALFEIAWLDTVIDVMGGLATVLLTWFLFPGVVSAVIGIFLEEIAAAVEAKHYPGLDAAPGIGIGEEIVAGLRFLGAVVVLNLVLLVFLLIPPVFPFVFYAANGYLLGREYFELVAQRRLKRADAQALRRRRKGSVFIVGVAIAFLLTVPLVNLLAPIVATAAMVHLFEKWRRAA